MVRRKQFNIFRKGSRTYFTSSLLFPREIRDKVFTLYAFVRVADDYVDSIPQRKKQFYKFVEQYNEALKTGHSGNIVVDDFVNLMNEVSIKPVWVNAFIEAMESDLYKKKYETMKELEGYMYGSAEVIGLMMAQIMKLPKESHIYARLLGKSMQYANFIRDIAEDNELNRQYIPSKVLRKYGLNNTKESCLLGHFSKFEKLISEQIILIQKWQTEAEQGFSFIPRRIRIAIKTASEMYKWTMREILADPSIIFKKKVKPSHSLLIAKAIQTAFTP